MSTISQNSIKRKKKPQHSKSAKKIKNKQRSKSKRKSVPIVLNDDSDGEIEDTALNSNPIIVPIVIRSLKTDNNNKNNRHEEHILSPNELEKMLNKEDNTANEATKIHSFDYDFMSQQTQNQIARHLVATPSAQTNAKHNQARLLQTPTSIPATPLIATPAPTFIKPTAKTTNRCKLKRSNRNIKRNKKRKFKPPRLVHQSRSVPPKHNKNTTKKKPFRVPKMRPLSTTQRPTKKISKKAADFDAFLQSAFTTGDTTHNDTDTTHTTSKDRPIATSGCFKSLHQNPFLQSAFTTGVDATDNDTDTTHTTSKDRPIATSGCFKSLHQNPFLQSAFTTGVDATDNDTDTTHTTSKDRPIATSGFAKANAQPMHTKKGKEEMDVDLDHDHDQEPKPQPTVGFSKASRSLSNQNTIRSNFKMRPKIKKPHFDKAKFKQFCMNNTMDETHATNNDQSESKQQQERLKRIETERVEKQKEEEERLRQKKEEERRKQIVETETEEEAEEPYTVFINAIPEFNETQMEEENMENWRQPLHALAMNHDTNIDKSEPTPHQLDAMSHEEYTQYKNKLKLTPTRSITSANSLLYRVIPPVKPNLSASKSSISRSKLSNFDALLDQMQSKTMETPKQKHKQNTTMTPVMRQRAAQRNRMAKLDGSTHWWSKLQSQQQEKAEPTHIAGKLQNNRIYTPQHKVFQVDTAATWSRKRKMDFDHQRPSNDSKRRKTSNTPWTKQIRNRKQPKSAPTLPKYRSKHTSNSHSKDGIHFKIADFNSRPSMKDVIDRSCINQKGLPIFSEKELSKQFGINADIIHMSLLSAQEYTFSQSTSTSIAPFLLNEDDVTSDTTDADPNELMDDDWSNMQSDAAFNHHIRNQITNKSHQSSQRSGGGGKGYSHAYQQLLELGCDSKLLSTKWVQHHWKMIVWSLACRVRSLPFKLNASSYFSYANVLEHLKYRYEYELNGGHVSTLHKMYRGDLSAACYVTLAVSRIVYATPNNKMKSNRLWLTDGWYEIEATFLDSDVESLVECGDIKLGDKVKICLARKEGVHCEPLEAKAVQVSIQIARNYVRKAAWYKKLGHARVAPNIFRVSLRSIHCNGGCVPYIYCCVTRRYENQYSVKVGNEKKGNVYTPKAKARLDTQYENDRYSKSMEVRVKIAKEMGLDRYQDQNECSIDRKELQKRIDECRRRVREQVSSLPSLNRKISEFFTCKISEVGSTGRLLDAYSTEITVWNPNENVSHSMKQGNYVKIYNVNTQNRVNAQSKMVQLSAGTRTRFEEVNVERMGYTKDTIEYNYERYIATRYCAFDNRQMANVEVDMIGCIVKVMNDRLFVIGWTQQNNQNELPLISMEVKQNEYTVHYGSIKPNSIYMIKNVKYDGYDRNLALHSTRAYQRTEFISNASRNVQFQNAKQFVMTEHGQRQIQCMLHTIDTKILNY
eukprot:495940_1